MAVYIRIKTRCLFSEGNENIDDMSEEDIKSKIVYKPSLRRLENISPISEVVGAYNIDEPGAFTLHFEDDEITVQGSIASLEKRLIELGHTIKNLED